MLKQASTSENGTNCKPGRCRGWRSGAGWRWSVILPSSRCTQPTWAGVPVRCDCSIDFSGRVPRAAAVLRRARFTPRGSSRSCAALRLSLLLLPWALSSLPLRLQHRRICASSRDWCSADVSRTLPQQCGSEAGARICTCARRL